MASYAVILATSQPLNMEFDGVKRKVGLLDEYHLISHHALPPLALTLNELKAYLVLFDPLTHPLHPPMKVYYSAKAIVSKVEYSSQLYHMIFSLMN